MGKQRSRKTAKKPAVQKEREEATTSAGKKNHLSFAFMFIVVFLTFLAYTRSLHGPLILDDISHLNSSSLENISRYFSLSSRSVAMASFALNYYISGMNLVAFKITNVILHIVSVLLVFYLTRMTLNLPSVREKYGWSEDDRTPAFIALLTATLFSLHPIQTAAVSYMVQRMAVMAGIFSFAAMIMYVRGASNTGRKSLYSYAFSVLFLILGIFSKENAVMILPVLILYDFVFISSFRWSEFRKRFLPIVSLGIILGSFAVYYFHVGAFIGKIVTLASNPHKPIGTFGWSGMDIYWTPLEFVLTELRIVSRYIFLILFPLPSFMVFDYSNAYPVSKDLLNPITTLLSLFSLSFIFFLAVRYIKKFPLLSFGVIWYLVTISLESFVAIGLDPYFEHRNYLPSYGIFLALSSLLVYVDKRGMRVRKEAIVLVVALMLSVLTFIRNGVWGDGMLLWEDAMKKAPNSARAHISLAFEYARKGLQDEAIEQYLIGLNLKPDVAAARYNLGNAYMAKGLMDKAIEEYRKAIDMKPDLIGVHQNLGLALSRKGLWDEAIEQYLIAIKSDPGDATAHENLGVAYAQKGLADKAIEHFRIALTLDPLGPAYRENLGNAYRLKKSGGKLNAATR
jgi:Flp pilus assembly protein TadD